jgi:hypothetical protein
MTKNIELLFQTAEYSRDSMTVADTTECCHPGGAVTLRYITEYCPTRFPRAPHRRWAVCSRRDYASMANLAVSGVYCGYEVGLGGGAT